MKILTVAIPNHHFFQWVNQLEVSGFEVYWFDINDGGPPSDSIPWVKQLKGWKLKWDFPFRIFLKKRLPKVYRWIQQYNENEVEHAFAKAYKQINPDIIHCFEMQLAGLPIMGFLNKIETPLIYSSWGSDLFDYERLGMSIQQVNEFLTRSDYLITDCNRDIAIARDLGFTGTLLGVFPGNGGLSLTKNDIAQTADRDTILIKGYDDGVGKASVVLEALALVHPELLAAFDICIYSADRSIEKQVKASSTLVHLPITVVSRHSFMKNTALLKIMGRSAIHIGNSLSDGMPNALLEAMGMGAFPIQSNPGGATAEVINDGVNGILIKDPEDVQEICKAIEASLENIELRKKAQDYNIKFIEANYDREYLRPFITDLYKNVALNTSLE